MYRRTKRINLIVLVMFLTFFIQILSYGRTIGVIPAGSGHAFWNSVEAGAKQAGKDHNVDIYFRGPNDEAHTDAQKLVINSVVSKDIIGLVLAPSTQERAKEVEELKAKGIPTVFIDRDTGGAENISVIATDNFKAGKLAGEKMVKILGGKGRVAVLRLKEGVVSTTARENGFIEAALSGGLEVYIDEYIGTSIKEARKNMIKIEEDLKSIDGIFTPNESTTMGAMAYLKNIEKISIKHIGFDSSNHLIKALDSGDIEGLIVQKPYQMGYQGVVTILNYLDGKKVEKNIDPGFEYAEKTNMNDPSIMQLLTMEYE